MEKSYEFDDVLIKPIASSVTSRDEVDITVTLPNGLVLDFPLIASPMVGVVDGIFARKLSELGGIAIFHRFYKTRDALFEDLRTVILDESNYGISLSVGEEYFEEYFDVDVIPDIVLVDTANGYNPNLLKYCEKVKNYLSKNSISSNLMAGNIVTFGGCLDLHHAGCDIVRVGIGGGSPCSTRNQTGIGLGNISALMESLGTNALLAIDGGIKNSGDFVKAVAAGADLGISGKLYAECYESPNKGILYGMASRTHMQNTKSDIKSIEGFDTVIKKKHSLSQFVREFGYGIKSAGTYLDARNLTDIFINSELYEVSNHAIKKGI